MSKPTKTNRLIGSRVTEELVAEKWHRIEGVYRYNHEAILWLESDAMKGRWCMPVAPVAHGLYFELEEDRVRFWMLWA